MVISFYKCNNCKLYLADRKTCQLMIPQMKGKIEPTDYCSKHMPEIQVCMYCGQPLLTPLVEVIKEDETRIYCQTCYMTRQNMQSPSK